MKKSLQILTMLIIVASSVVLVACDGNASSNVTPTPSNGGTVSPGPREGKGLTPTATPPIDNGTRGPKGGAMDAKLVDVQVWQDFMPRIGSGGPPLHATLIVEVSDALPVTPSNTNGTITITQPNGAVITHAHL